MLTLKDTKTTLTSIACLILLVASNSIMAAPKPRVIKIDTLRGHTDDIRTLTFSHDDSILASAGMDRIVHVWHRNDTGKFDSTNRTQLTGHTNWILTLAFSHDDNTLASAGMDRIVRIWHKNDTGQFDSQNTTQLTGHTDWIDTLAFSHDDSTLASAGRDRIVRVWHRNDTGRFDSTNTTQLTGHTDCINILAFSHDDSTLASAGKDKVVRVWHRNDTGQFDSQNTTQLTGHTDWIYTLAFSHDDSTLAAAGSNDNVIRLWYFEQPTNLSLLQLTEKESEEETCCICLGGADKNNPLQYLPCYKNGGEPAHSDLIHKECWQRCIKANKSCPLCRKPVE